MTAAGIPALLEPIQERAGAESGCSSDPCGSKVCKAQRDRARLLAAVKAVVAESGEVVADSEGLGLDFQEDDFDRGYHAARRQTVQQILEAVEAALRSEA